ncbi:hypothetical protein H9C73_02945 [Marinobacterium sp. AK62]|uniref:Uncharacterized protein n=1 Tax=Marinobacterium alkalitolerans TaxID=1542925 RepID=A0ABS3Z7I9_9GAMM|nr:hypothetical protein [Marinobacterium alkalitolerans]MBP0047681.1 hypothetical protein [Marinobacterium alkalitolerans]
MTLEMVVALYVLLFGLVSLFAAGWAVATAIYCLRAKYKGEPVGPVFQAMLKEW